VAAVNNIGSDRLAVGLATAGLLAVPLLLGSGTATAAVDAPRPPAPAASTAAASATAPVVGPNHMRGLHGAHRVMIVTAAATSSTHALVRRYRLVHGHYRRVGGVAHARIGLNGLSRPKSRHEGDAKTPMGIYRFVYGFGSRPNPGMTGLKWRPLTPGSCWAGTRKDYNRWVRRTPCNPADENLWSSEDTAYRYAAVIDFNYAHPVFGRGSGIFLHRRLDVGTHGCVSLYQDTLVKTLRWLRPSTRIVIGTPSSLRALTR
jgi:L,D-peptidoglycan transpeptidase YkuD (ErfK/YbiS/YcfS/YnhG family)